MQDTLWCCQERIVPKKVWRVINYESKLKAFYLNNLVTDDDIQLVR